MLPKTLMCLVPVFILDDALCVQSHHYMDCNFFIQTSTGLEISARLLAQASAETEVSGEFKSWSTRPILEGILVQFSDNNYSLAVHHKSEQLSLSSRHRGFCTFSETNEKVCRRPKKSNRPLKWFSIYRQWKRQQIKVDVFSYQKPEKNTDLGKQNR